MQNFMTRSLMSLLLAGFLVACGEEGFMFEAERSPSSDQDEVGAPGGELTMKMDWEDEDPDSFEIDPMFEISIASPEETARLFEGGIARLVSPLPFRQLGTMMDALDVSNLQYRALKPDGSYTDWEDVFVYFSEGIIHNAHIVLDFATTEVQLRGGESILSGIFEFREQAIARKEIITADNGGRPSWEHDPESDLRVTQLASVAPSSLVIPRSSWGAINPGKICGSVVRPYRMTIHHTYRPSDDGGDAAARLRGMQSYHINTNKWCDIGYHFVVAQSGRIYQGRSRSDRPGAHTINQNSGNVGVALIGDFAVQTPTNTQLDAAARIVRWVHDTHGVVLTRTAVRGHREWPGQSTSCPGANMINRISNLLDRARDTTTTSGGGAGSTSTSQVYDVTIAINYIGLQNFYTSGSSENTVDALPGDRFQAEIVVTNNSGGPIRGVQLGYHIYAPYIQATNYVIETDYPEKDKRSWKRNDADGAPENPARHGLGASGALAMYGFGAGESKRVLFDLQADQYSIGFVDYPNVRGWIKNINDVYVQNGYSDDPTVNQIGSQLRASSSMDVLSRQEWQFQGPSDADLEGWTGTGQGHYEILKVNTWEDVEGMLAMKVTGSEAGVVSPQWTYIDANQYDELVLEVRSHDGPHIKAVYWSREGESFSEARVVRFAAEGDSEMHTMVVPLGHHPEWSGVIQRLRIDLIDDRAPVANGWQDLGKVYFQDSTTRQTTSYTLNYVALPPVALIGRGHGDPRAMEDGELFDSQGLVPSPRDPNEPGELTSRSLDPETGMLVTTHQGCSTSGAPAAPGPLAMWLLLGLAWVWRRK
jgi:MYXO-CTERM domain-containing protein